MTDRWIEIPRWFSEDGHPGFQFDKTRQPIWIKNYTQLLSDEAYLALSGHQRAVLHGLWLEYARGARQNHDGTASVPRRLPDSTRSLSRRISLRVSRATLEALNHAGFIRFVAHSVRTDCVQLVALEEKREEKTNIVSIGKPIDTSKPKKQKPKTDDPKPRPRDELWDAWVTEVGEPVTDSERGRLNKALAELRKIDATAEQLQQKIRRYRSKWPGIELSPQAVVGNWSSLGRNPWDKPNSNTNVEAEVRDDEDDAVRQHEARLAFFEGSPHQIEKEFAIEAARQAKRKEEETK